MVRFRPDTCRALQLYEWPGNVRELENLVARAILRASADQLEKDLVVVAPHHFGGAMLSTGNLNASENDANTKMSRIVKPLKSAIDDLQRNLIQAALMNSNGNWTAAAKELGINRSNLHKLAKRLKIK